MQFKSLILRYGDIDDDGNINNNDLAIQSSGRSVKLWRFCNVLYPGFYLYMPLMSLAKVVNIKQLPTPIIVGMSAEISVHLALWVSFFIVSRVVEQGQCIRKNRMTLIAVIQVQPLSINSCFNADRLSSSSIFPFAR